MNKRKNNFNWCWHCQDWKNVLGHSEIDCPKVLCKDCAIFGHIKPNCPNQEKNNNAYCWQCSNWKKALGHSQIDCPYVICKNCSLVGHVRHKCSYPLYPKIRNVTPGSGFSNICENCSIVAHNGQECPYPTVRIVGIVTPRCEFCYGGHTTENCVTKPIHDLLNKNRRNQKAKKLAEKKAKIDKKMDLEVKVIGMSTRSGPFVNPEY